MGTVEERIAAVEARAGEHSVMMDAIRQSLDRLDQRFTAFHTHMDERFSAIDQRLTAMDSRIDQRFTAIDQRFSATDQRFVTIDQRFVAIDQRFVAIDLRFTTIDQRFVAIDGHFAAVRAEMSHHFHWILGVQVTVFVGIIAAMISGFLALR